jgi:hypothetical protein
MKILSGFWSFDWLFGKMKDTNGDDLYGPQDSQFMIFGNYPYSRSRNRIFSQQELYKIRELSEEEKQARLEGLQRVAISNYNYEKKNGMRQNSYHRNKINPY